jgi:hypothetical protein
VSLFQGEKLTVALCPDQIGVVWRTRRAEVRRELVLCTAPEGGGDWFLAMDALRNWLDAAQVQRGRISIVLSSRFVRYALVPWQETYLKREEEDAWGRVHFEALYGDMKGWRIVSSPDRYGRAHVACAISVELGIHVRELCAVRRLSGGAVVPYFVACWNRWRRDVDPGRLFGVAESDSFVLGCHGPAGWESLRVLLAKATPDGLSVIAAREQVLQGRTDGHPAKLHVPGSVRVLQDGVVPCARVDWLALDAETDEAPALAMARLMETA